MPSKNTRDPRWAVVREKYFSLRPKPLERWLWRQGLPQAAERVFWLHWEEGMRSGDWCSEIPVKRVARECCVDTSTVTRAYQLLKAKGLIRREDPGRDPKNPFCQATAVTEVRLPREFLTELHRSPNRPAHRSTPVQAETQEAAIRPPEAAQSPEAPEPPLNNHPTPIVAPAGSVGDITQAVRRPSRHESQALWGKASAAERARFFAASRDRRTYLDFDAHTKLTPEDRGQMLAQLARLASAKLAPSNVIPKSVAEYAGPRRLSVLELARARKRVLETVPSSTAPEVLRQVIWAVEEGALRRFPMPLALNIALKKIREGAWSRPNRMPPNWLPRARGGQGARPEQCSAA